MGGQRDKGQARAGRRSAGFDGRGSTAGRWVLALARMAWPGVKAQGVFTAAYLGVDCGLDCAPERSREVAKRQARAQRGPWRICNLQPDGLNL